jgi:hypothetical protein
MVLGGLDVDEREMLQMMILHYVQALNAERSKSADLTRRLECERERVALLEVAAYGCSFL